MLFHDRADAGRQLAAKLTAYAGRPDVLVLALPRGGVPVGYEVAQCWSPIGCLSRPQTGRARPRGTGDGRDGHGRRPRPERGRGPRARHPGRGHRVGVGKRTGGASPARAGLPGRPAAAGRSQSHRSAGGRRPGHWIHHASGRRRLAQAASGPHRRGGAGRLGQTCAEMAEVADDAICSTPEPFYAVGLWYGDFTQTTDEEVHELLDRAGAPSARRE